ncbi:unnamed protein product [Closterium sp. Naga37s-1]|nr:unnamed protein product [Closterium sp. Naga37s-1]
MSESGQSSIEPYECGQCEEWGQSSIDLGVVGVGCYSLQGAEALQQGSWQLFGRLLSESGQSNRAISMRLHRPVRARSIWVGSGAGGWNAASVSGLQQDGEMLEGAEALQQGRWHVFGRLMLDLGQSSIKQYEFAHHSCPPLTGTLLSLLSLHPFHPSRLSLSPPLTTTGSPPLIELQSILLATPGVLGARFSGAGFRGCCVALVEREKVADVARHMAEEYSERQPELAAACQKDSMVVVCDISEGARVKST